MCSHVSACVYVVVPGVDPKTGLTSEREAVRSEVTGYRGQPPSFGTRASWNAGSSSADVCQVCLSLLLLLCFLGLTHAQDSGTRNMLTSVLHQKLNVSFWYQKLSKHTWPTKLLNCISLLYTLTSTTVTFYFTGHLSRRYNTMCVFTCYHSFVCSLYFTHVLLVQLPLID